MTSRQEKIFQVAVASFAALAIVGFLLFQKSIARRYRITKSTVIELPGTGLKGVAIQILRGNDRAWNRRSKVRLIDRTGQNFVVQSADATIENHEGYTFFIPFGYAHPIDSLRLEIEDEEGRVETLPLPAFPPPIKIRLHPSRHKAFRIFRDGATDAVVLKPRAALPRNEGWRIEVLRTEHNPKRAGVRYRIGLDAESVLTTNIREQRLTEPYIEQSDAVEVLIKRVEYRQHEEVLQLRGLYLAEKLGETCAYVPKERTDLIAGGGRIVLPKQLVVPHRASWAKDHRNVMFRLDLPSKSWSRSEVSYQLKSVEIVATSPASLHLRHLRIGPATFTGVPDLTKPAYHGEFGATLRVRTLEIRSLPEIRATVPIESAGQRS